MYDCPDCDGTGEDSECDGHGCSNCDHTGNCQPCAGTGNDPKHWNGA